MRRLGGYMRARKIDVPLPLPPSRDESLARSGMIPGTAIFDADSNDVDPFTQSGRWRCKHNGPAFLQYNFDGVYDVSQVSLGYLGLGGSGPRLRMKKVEIRLKKQDGTWFTVGTITNTYVGWGARSDSVEAPFVVELEPRFRSVAIRVDVEGDGWKVGQEFSVRGVRVE